MQLLLAVIFDLAIFATVTSLAFALAMMAEAALLQRRRLGEQTAASPSSSQTPLLQPQAEPGPLFQWIEQSSSISEPAERQKLRRELALAGFDSPSAPVWYVIARFALAIGLPMLFLFTQYASSKPMTGFGLIFWALVLCGAGLVAPGSFVTRKAAARRTELEFEFPDALDLMVVCVEAGLSLDATFVRVAEEARETHPRIAGEFARVSEEIHAGRSRADAMRAMAERTDVAGIKAFVALVVQTEALGSSIAQTLRTYSNELRETRFIKAEEKALRIPVLMTLPLVACILPVIVTALLLPPIIDMVRTLFPALSGHH